MQLFFSQPFADRWLWDSKLSGGANKIDQMLTGQQIIEPMLKDTLSYAARAEQLTEVRPRRAHCQTIANQFSALERRLGATRCIWGSV